MALDNMLPLTGGLIQITEGMQEADHEDLGTLSVHTGTHPVIGEVVIVSSNTRDAVLIHGSAELAL